MSPSHSAETDEAKLGELIRSATMARSLAYVPYSHFDAGAAVRADDGSIHSGSVVENISLGLAMCAERVALFATIAAGQRPTELLLIAPATDGGLTMPCGACCQVALELGGPNLVVRSVDPEDSTMVTTETIGALLPRGPHRSSD